MKLQKKCFHSNSDLGCIERIKSVSLATVIMACIEIIGGKDFHANENCHKRNGPSIVLFTVCHQSHMQGFNQKILCFHNQVSKCVSLAA
jgi:hypothetical protein